MTKIMMTMIMAMKNFEISIKHVFFSCDDWWW